MLSTESRRNGAPASPASTASPESIKSSVGQAIGYIGGAIIGSFFGYPVLGAAIGGMIGGALVDLGAEYFNKRDEEKVVPRLTKRIRDLGYDVEAKKAA